MSFRCSTAEAILISKRLSINILTVLSADDVQHLIRCDHVSEDVVVVDFKVHFQYSLKKPRKVLQNTT